MGVVPEAQMLLICSINLLEKSKNQTMKTTLVLIITCLITANIWAQNETASLSPDEVKVSAASVELSEAEAKLIYVEATNLAKDQLLDFIASEVNYPEALQEQYLEGQMVVDFWIDTNGQIQKTKLMKGINDEFDEAILNKLEGIQSLRIDSSKYLGANRIRIPIDFSMY